MKSALFYLFGGSIMSIVAIVLGTILSSKKAKKYGERIGKLLTRFARLKMGKKVWEKLEDKITSFFVEFAKGLKTGADSDDNVEYEFEKKKKD